MIFTRWGKGVLYLGLILIFIAGGYFVNLYTDSIKRRHSEYVEILSLIVYIRSSLSSSTRSIAEILSGFKSDVIKKCGITYSDKIHEKESSLVGLDNSTQKAEDADVVFERNKIECSKLSVDEEDKEKFTRFIKNFGKSSLQEEEKKVNDMVLHFESKEKAVKIAAEKDVKLVWTLFTCGFIVIAIFAL